MRVFLSWAGDTSKQLALALRDWLPLVLQAIEPFMSAEDIDKGARWETTLSMELQETTAGVICVTPESVASTWLHFEAGAISKAVGKKVVLVIPYALGFRKSTDVRGPLSTFQSALATRDETRRMIGSLNRALEKPLPETLIDKAFDADWPKLERRLAAIGVREQPARSDRDLLEEVLIQCRAIANAVIAARSVTANWDRIVEQAMQTLPQQHLLTTSPVKAELLRRLVKDYADITAAERATRSHVQLFGDEQPQKARSRQLGIRRAPRTKLATDPDYCFRILRL